METWKKYAIVITVIVLLTIPLTLLAVNFNGWGASVSGSTGPFTSGLYKIGVIPVNWALTNGYTLLLFYVLLAVLWPLIVAFVVWHYDIGYKFSNSTTTTNPASGYDNNMSLEPAEPEQQK